MILKQSDKVPIGSHLILHAWTSFSNQNKKILVILFDTWGTVHSEFAPTGQTVNHMYYLGVLKWLFKKVRRKQLELLPNNSQLVHHDNTPAHTAYTISIRLIGQQTNNFGRPPAVLTWLRHQWLLSSCKDQRSFEGNTFWGHWGHKG